MIRVAATLLNFVLAVAAFRGRIYLRGKLHGANLEYLIHVTVIAYPMCGEGLRGPDIFVMQDFSDICCEAKLFPCMFHKLWISDPIYVFD